MTNEENRKLAEIIYNLKELQHSAKERMDHLLAVSYPISPDEIASIAQDVSMCKAAIAVLTKV